MSLILTEHQMRLMAGNGLKKYKRQQLNKCDRENKDDHIHLIVKYVYSSFKLEF